MKPVDVQGVHRLLRDRCDDGHPRPDSFLVADQVYEAATYRDVDAVIASGILHSFDSVGVTKFVATLYPAAADPRFRGSTVDPGYLTTLPGTRGKSFYYLPNTDPQVVDTDERLKETATVLEAGGVFQEELPGVPRPGTDRGG